MQNAAPAEPETRDAGQADAGKRRIEWAFASMPVLQKIRKQFIRDQPLAGASVSVCLPVAAESANLMVTLRDGGAFVSICTANTMPGDDDVLASLERDYGIVAQPADAALSGTARRLVIEEGATMFRALHTGPADASETVIGGTEGTSSGISRIRRAAADKGLRYPVIAVNEAPTPQLIQTSCGTGQCVLDAITRTTNTLFAGATVVVSGYGAAGAGIASRARGLGASVIVTEVDPARAVAAVMDGFRVMPLADAAGVGEIFITASHCRSVVGREAIEKLKDGAILCNAGHGSVEIDLECLGRVSTAKRTVREFVEEYRMRDGRKVLVLCGGAVVHLTAGDGYPASVRDMSFATQALSAAHIVRNAGSLGKQVYAVPDAIDNQVARMKLDAMGVSIDRLTIEQEKYLGAWNE
jgi:adenosylhomocysteinase